MKRFLSIILSCLVITGTSWAGALPLSVSSYYNHYGRTATDNGNVPSKTFMYGSNAAYSQDNDILLNTDFTGDNPMLGWTLLDNNGDNITWDILDGIKGMTYDGENATGAADDWAITPELNIADGQNYLIEIVFNQSGAFGADNIEVKCGNAATAEGMAEMIATAEIEFEYGFGSKSLSYLMNGNASNRYIGMHISTPEPNGKLSIASIKVSAVENPTPCSAEDFVVTADNAAGSVKMSWKNPSKDTNGVDISMPMTAKIYENDVPVGSVNDMAAGGNGEYTYYPTVFAGTATYSLKMCIGEKESEAVSQTINLDDLQGELVLVKSFSDVNKKNSADWAIEDNDGKFKWEYDYANVFRFNYGGFGNKKESDWLISPSFTLECGQRYIVKYELKTSKDYASSIDVYLGNAQNSESMSKVLNTHKDLTQNGFGEFETAQFSVDESGDYNIGFYVYDANYAISMRNLEIYAVGQPTDIRDASVDIKDIYYDAPASTLYLPYEGFMAEVYDMQGMLVNKYTVEGDMLNLSELGSGIYCIKLSSSHGYKSVFKLVK